MGGRKMANKDAGDQNADQRTDKREAQDREKGAHAQSPVDSMHTDAPSGKKDARLAEEGKGPSRPHGDKAADIIPD
jgi:hypothetical protein